MVSLLVNCGTGRRSLSATDFNEPTAEDTLANAGCSHGVAPSRAESSRGRPFYLTFNGYLRSDLAERRDERLI